MALLGSSILVWVEPPTAYVRLVGRAAVEGSRDFKALILRLEQEGIHQFCLDLSECKIMDSTFSGVLAALATDLAARPSRDPCAPFTVVNPNERVRDLLDNLGVLPLVNLLDQEGILRKSEDAQVITGSASSKLETAECCLEAHRFLMALKPENKAKFAEVTRILEQQIEAAH